MMRSGRPAALGRGSTVQRRVSGRKTIRSGRFTTAPSPRHRSRRGGMWLSDGLSQSQSMRLTIEIENLSVAAPIHGRFKLALHFIFAEMFVENVVKEFFRNRVVSLGVKNAVDLLQDDYVVQRGLPENNFARQNVRLRKARALGCDLDITFL